MNILTMIDDYGIKSPNRIAHVYRESSLSYGELLNKSNAIAFFLKKNFGEDKSPIIVFGHKQQDMLVCFLGCVKAGHPYIPIDSSLPLQRIKDIIDSSKSKLIFSVGELELEFNNIQTVLRSEIQEIYQVNKNVDIKELTYVGLKDVFYIIYTSGSTGEPKGVQITLESLQSFIKWGNKIATLDENIEYVFMNQAPFSFDLSVMDLYLSLASGSTLYSIDKNMISNIKELFQYLEKSKISIWVSTPSFAEMCLADSKFNSVLLDKLQVLLFCGETLTNSCVERLHQRFTNARIVNLYGPTEATVAITAIEIDKELNEKCIPLPVGSVKENCSIEIIDKNGAILPDGERGEIIIIGDSVSIGYYENKFMTKKAFFEKNYNGNIERAYRTGDEGYLKDGLLYYSGRIDFQVKLNGFRIELEDIETNLRKVSIIKNCVVLPYIKDTKIQYLSSFVVLNQKIEEKDFKIVMRIKEELKKFIPEYMIPRKIVIREQLPMTTNGKVNRKLLLEELS